MKTAHALLLVLLLTACTAAEPSPSPSLPQQPAPLATLPPPAEGTVPPPPPTLRPADGTPPPPSTLPPDPSPAAGSPAARPPTPAGPAPPGEELRAELQALLDDWLAGAGAPGAVLGVGLADGRTVVVAAGRTDDAGGFAVEPDHRFRIGSITKSFVAVLLMQLAEEGLLDLDDMLADHLPWAPHADRVSLRQLLAHTSGMPDFAAELAYREALLADPGRAWTARETVELVADRDLLFQPGRRWSYSNTNYSLAGLVAEEVAGQPLADLLRRRIGAPADLTRTYLEGREEAPPIETAGHFDIDGDGRAENVRVVPYTALVTSGAAAGGLSSTARDVLAFSRSLAAGRLVSAAGLEELTAPSEASPGYGLGLSLFQRGGRSFWGHAGALPGYSALFAHAPAERVSAVALVNQSGANVQDLLEDAFALTGEQ